MKEIEIINPNNIIFPLDKRSLESSKVIYHGTNSIFSAEIEKEGWIVNCIPYNLEDAKYICDTYDRIGKKGPNYSTLKSFTLQSGNIIKQIKKFPWFSGNYWIARNFASYPGGESIAHILKAVNELLNYEQISDNKILALQKKYNNLIQHSIGIVYIVEVEADGFSSWEAEAVEPILEIMMNFDIPSEWIIAQIVYPNGITTFRPDYKYPLPVLWNIESFKKKIKKSDYQYQPNEAILKQYE